MRVTDGLHPGAAANALSSRYLYHHELGMYPLNGRCVCCAEVRGRSCRILKKWKLLSLKKYARKTNVAKKYRFPRIDLPSPATEAGGCTMELPYSGVPAVQMFTHIYLHVLDYHYSRENPCVRVLSVPGTFRTSTGCPWLIQIHRKNSEVN